MAELGYIVYEGPSRLDGTPIVAILTQRSGNMKTGALSQVWILCQDKPPVVAVRDGSDAAICGTCAFRPHDGGKAGGCYVSVMRGPNTIWRAYRNNRYARGVAPREIGRGRQLRLGAYGDPGAVPTRVWAELTKEAEGWTGYTHAWRRRPSLKPFVMASVESLVGAAFARARGWRTFRVYRNAGPVRGLEIECPASAEMGHRVQCSDCMLCAGTSRPAKSITIRAHGWNEQAARAE